ncbi:hypothetical protein [Streptomyces scopuliridis]|uniref:hypothetical protein n=2 Tax=Streptomyces scopuliridis TaxID=452529 RepID=UPI003427287A
MVNVTNSATSCYDSFTDAMAKATDGRITDAPNNSRAAVADPRLVAQLNSPTATSGSTKGVTGGSTGTAALAPISIMYKNADYGGDSLIYQGDFDCSGPTDQPDYWVELIQPGWNDEIGSYRAYRNCWLSLFEHRGWTGGSIGYAGNRTDLGILDDKASSIRWS